MSAFGWFGLRRRNMWEPPTALDKFLASPLQAIARRAYHFILFLRGRPFRASKTKPPIRVVCISDTHDKTAPVPDGDLLIHAGDLTDPGTIDAIQVQIDWLDSLPHRHKVFVCGNHDSWFDPASRKIDDHDSRRTPDYKSLHYLQDASVTLEFEGGRELNVYGAGDVPLCGGSAFAFQYSRHLHPWKERVPMETDVLVTHTPPRHHMDLQIGCDGLLEEVWRVKPRLHVFGHVHWGHGREAIYFDECQKRYERISSRLKGGPLRDLVAFTGWRDYWMMLLHGVHSILWKWLMLGPGSNNAGLMVNAALVRGNTGMIKNKAEVVDL